MLFFMQWCDMVKGYVIMIFSIVMEFDNKNLSKPLMVKGIIYDLIALEL